MRNIIKMANSDTPCGPSWIYRLISFILCWIALVFHILNASPYKPYYSKYSTEIYSRSDILVACDLTITTTVFGIFTGIVIPLVGLILGILGGFWGSYIALVNACCSEIETPCYASKTASKIFAGIYLLFLLLTVIFNVSYQVTFFLNSEALQINTLDFFFISGWIGIGFWVGALLVGLFYLGGLLISN